MLGNRRRINQLEIGANGPTVAFVSSVIVVYQIDDTNTARRVLEGRVKEMCEVCWESYHAGYMTRTEVWQCVYYLGIIRSYRDELRRIPKRDPDDPRYTVDLGEGLLPFMFDNLRDEKDWFFLIYLPTRRRKIFRLNASGEGAERSQRESATRGVEDETNGWLNLSHYDK